jgi:nickel/cobalt exporter
MVNKYLAGLVLSALLIIAFHVATPVSAGPLSLRGPEKQTAFTVRYPMAVSKLIRQINRWQRTYNRQIAVLAKNVKNGASPRIFLSLLLVAFLYGTVHALGPGHGKALVFSYFLSRGSNQWKKGLLLGNLIAFLHAASATIIVLTVYFGIKNSLMNRFDTANQFIRRISSVMIIGVGLLLLVGQIKLFVKPCREESSASRRVRSDRSLLATAVAIGVAPCPGVVIVLLFTLNLGLLSTGLLMVFFMALGMAVTISLAGILCIIARQGVGKIISGSKRGLVLWENVAGICGAALIVLAGLFLGLTG